MKSPLLARALAMIGEVCDATELTLGGPRRPGVFEGQANRVGSEARWRCWRGASSTASLALALDACLLITHPPSRFGGPPRGPTRHSAPISATARAALLSAAVMILSSLLTTHEAFALGGEGRWSGPLRLCSLAWAQGGRPQLGAGVLSPVSLRLARSWFGFGRTSSLCWKVPQWCFTEVVPPPPSPHAFVSTLSTHLRCTNRVIRKPPCEHL